MTLAPQHSTARPSRASIDLVRLAAWLILAMVLVAVLLVAMWSLLHYLAIRSESFRFIDSEVRRSTEVRADVGKVLQVKPAPFGPYRYQRLNDEESLEVLLVVEGSNAKTEVYAEAKAAAGAWSLTRLQVASPKAGN